MMFYLLLYKFMKYKPLPFLFMASKNVVFGIIIQCIALTFVLAGEAVPQGNVSVNNVTVSLNVKNVTVKNVFELIESKTNYSFLYDAKLLRSQGKIDLDVKNTSLGEVLMMISQKTGLKFKQVNQTINVNVREKSEQPLEIILQSRIVSGVVTSGEDNEPLPGVNVVIKGNTAVGTITDINGKYSLTVQDNSVLVFSYIGFLSKEVPVDGRSQVNVIMEVDSKELEGVTVVAFGIQKKESVVSSVTTIRPGELKVPSSNLTTALAGRLSGVIAYQRSGEPGRDNAEFFIRGATTFGYKKDPLILIDGMEYNTTDLARINPDDIESFSIMKDATANALYGARGANGVIQVTTKSGVEGKAKFTFRIENTFSSPTRDIELADPISYMKLNNEAVLTRNPLGVLPYSQAKIENTEAGINPIVYPMVDWQEELFKEQTINQRANMGIRGGGKVATYFISAGFSQDNGILKVDKRNNFNSNINLKTYSIRSNIGINVTPTTHAMIRVGGSFDDYMGPIDGGEGIYNKVMRTSQTMFLPFYPVDEEHEFTNHILFGNAEQGQYLNPYADMVKGYKQYNRSLMLSQVELKQDLSFILKGLSLNGMANTHRRSYFDVVRQYNPFWYMPSGYNRMDDTYRLVLINPDEGTDYLDYEPSEKTVSSVFRGQAQLLWKNTFSKKHEVSAMAVLLAQSELTGNAGSLQESLPARNLGLSGRATYGYDNRYFFEINFGYNGSERFHESERYGFFPSAGFAWSVSNEEFFKSLGLASVSKLRLRGNYGLVGNDAIGSSAERFFYLSEVNMDNSSYGARFGRNGSYSRNGISVDRYSNEKISWETARNSTFGLEIGLLDKLDFIGEYFVEERYNILMSRASIPATMGLQGSTPKANVGRAATNAVDLSLDYGDYFTKDLMVSIRGNFTYAKNKFRAYEEPEYDYPWLYRVGNSTSQQWGYIAERLFVDDEEVRSSPTQNFNGWETKGGDIKFRDINRDGVINQLDQVPIGYPTVPEIIYGFGFSSKLRNWDFSAFLQGSARSSFWIDVEDTSPFIDQSQLLKAYADDYWSEENRNLYALWPRLSAEVNGNSNVRNTWFMRDGSFLRVKQVEAGYTFPQHRLKMENLRLYATATNLFTFSKFKLWDVEMAGNGLGYPIQKQICIGLEVGF